MLDRLRDRLLFPFARIIINAQSTLAWAKSRSQKPVVHFEAPHDGRGMLLLALYQKGRLRPDVRRLLKAASDQGLYILAVNTLRLLPDEIEGLKDMVDCYIERPNFGRDFGSYRAGFLHLMNKGWTGTCPRLLMLNDSVYFSQTRTPAFLRDMMSSPVEVLGATENFEIEYHLGSFCIAMDGSILRNPRFQKYWRDYSLTDVRPAVIKTGEMALSRLLKRIVASHEGFCALYSSERFVSRLAEDDDLLDFAIRNGRNSDLTGWRRITAAGLIDYLKGRQLVSLYQMTPDDMKAGSRDIQVEVSAAQLNKRALVNDFESLMTFLKSMLPEGESLDRELVRRLCASYVGETFLEGSQVHQNATILLRQGLPIINSKKSRDGPDRARLSRQQYCVLSSTQLSLPHQPLATGKGYDNAETTGL